MDLNQESPASDGVRVQKPALRFLVESALRSVMSGRNKSKPENHQEWVAYLAEALMSDSDTPYQSVLSSLMANGVSSKEVFHRYVPDAARYLGELWVSDKASFVDVTIGAARLQKLFCARETYSDQRWTGRSIPLGHSALMIIPSFEEHSLGAFVAADDLRRHGVWVQMAISLERDELIETIASGRCSMLGITLATPEALGEATKLIGFIRKKIDHLPPIVIGGRAVVVEDDAAARCGADFAATSAKEAIDRCGLASVAQSFGISEFCR